MMKALNTFGIFILILFISCGKSTETTVISDGTNLLPGSPADSGQVTQTTPTGPLNDDFVQLRIGEVNPIETLDPLFAQSNSELRIVHLIYEGLTQLNDQGDPVPAVAKRWEATRDSLRFTFTLDKDIFYHNSDVFSNGLGRRVMARDVEQAFLRMANVEVPDYAADMFENIRGFKSYHNEQTYVKNPAKRAISKIEGITVSNDSTIVFYLEQKDSDFLDKLAHPWASVYAPESLNNREPINRPVGSGPFYYVRTQDQDIILASNNDYPLAGDLPDRLDIKSGQRETDLYQEFARDELDLLIEIGPETTKTLIDDDRELSVSFRGNYQIYDPELNSTYTLYYNPGAERPEAAAYLSSLAADSIIADARLGSVEILMQPADSISTTFGQVQVSNTSNPFEMYLLNRVAEEMTPATTLSMNSSYAITQDVVFSADPFRNAEAALQWHTPLLSVTKSGFSGLNIAHTPWNISFSKITIPAGDN